MAGGKDSTWNIKEGYALDCDCFGNDQIGNQVDQVIELLERQNQPVTQTIVQATSGGTIPVGVQSYTITNLGIDPTDPTAGRNPMIINGIEFSTQYFAEIYCGYIQTP